MSRLARHGVLHRDAVKNDLVVIGQLVKRGLVRKSVKSGRVYYELTDAAVPVLEEIRTRLQSEVRLLRMLDKELPIYEAILGDLRFLDPADPEAQRFMFLGDWQLLRPVVPAQLELARLRFYRDGVLRRTRRAA